MGRRGPPRTPTAVLQRRGSWRAKARAAEPAPAKRHPEPPAWLSKHELDLYSSLCAQVESMGVLTVVDGQTLARYCRLFSRWAKAEAFLAKNGSVYALRDNAGNIKCHQPHPQVAEARALADQLLRIEQQFGLTPAARASLSIGKPERPDHADRRFDGD